MKNLIAFAAIASMAFLYSCGDDETEEPAPALPSISVTTTVNGTTATSPVQAAPSDSIGFDIAITAAGGFNVYRVFQSVDGGTATSLQEEDRLELGLDAGSTTATSSWSLNIENAVVGSIITLEFVVVDDASQEASTTVEIEVTSPEARDYGVVRLDVPLGNFSGQNFFATSTGTVYSSSEVTGTVEAISPLIDFGYYYGSTNGASIASPEGFKSTVFSDQVNGWNTTNATQIRSTTLDNTDFLEITTFADIDAAFEGGTDEAGIVTGLAVNDVVAFETVTGIRGVILVNDIEGTFNEDDYIDITVLVQEDAQ